jgi:carboxyl-terminal processing protease
MSLIILAERIILAALLFVPAAQAQQRPDLDLMARIVSEHQIARPPLDAIPADDIVSFDRFLRFIDPYAARLTQQQYRALVLNPPRQGFGVGGVVFVLDGHVRWLSYREGQAAREGLPAEAELTEISTTRLRSEMGREGVQNLLRLTPDPIELTFVGDPAVYGLSKATYDIPVVEFWDDEGRRIVRIFSFVEGRTIPDVTRALLGANEVVLDLRYSEGGSVYEAVDLMGLFLDAGLPAGGLMSADDHRQAFTVPALGSAFRGPVAVLTSPVTASAAEVFVAALRYHKRARIVGAPTFGKCEAQSFFPLPDGGALRLSVDRFVRPSGEACYHGSIIPDVPIPDDRMFDGAWILARAVGGGTTGDGGYRVCDAATYRTEDEARNRDEEIRNSVTLEKTGRIIEQVGLDRTSSAPVAFRVCFGPFARRPPAAALNKRLAELLDLSAFEVVEISPTRLGVPFGSDPAHADQSR